MEIDVLENGVIRLKKIFNSIVLETSEKNRFAICMRDDGLEIGIVDTSIKHPGSEKYFRWFKANNEGIKELVPTACKKIQQVNALDGAKNAKEKYVWKEIKYSLTNKGINDAFGKGTAPGKVASMEITLKVKDDYIETAEKYIDREIADGMLTRDSVLNVSN